MNDLSIRQMQLFAAGEEIRRCNDYSRTFGLSLTETEINDLVQLRAQALQSTGRVEFGGGILPKLVKAFCNSPYIDPYNYASTLADLQDAFYYFKNESEDRFSDDELVEFMQTVFDGTAHGSTEVLAAISLEELCRWARNGFDNRFADEEAYY